MIVLSAKHGRSPIDPTALTRIDDTPILDALNTARASGHPSSTAPLVAFSIADDGMLIWLHDRSTESTAFAKNFLLGHPGTGNDINGTRSRITSPA